MQNDIVGTEIDGYEIREILGSGGMGVVYRAKDVALSRDVALKCINRSLANDESFLRRFRSEARALAQIDSPYIVQVYTLSRIEIGLVIVMEFVNGGNLKERIGEGGISWQEALPFVQQMLTALGHAHRSDVIHRDIKPHNILVAEDETHHGNRVKMTDFGLAKINTTGDRSRTVTEGVYGSLNYMSPEQVEGLGDVDRRSDIYSLGMTIYEMLTGRLPFDEEGTTYRIMRTIVEEELPPLSQFVEDVPPTLADIVMKALRKEPASRFQSVEAMHAEVDDLADRYSERMDGISSPVPKETTVGAAEETVVEGRDDGERVRESSGLTSLIGVCGGESVEFIGSRIAVVVLLFAISIAGIGAFMVSSTNVIGMFAGDSVHAGPQNVQPGPNVTLPESLAPLVQFDQRTELVGALDKQVRDGRLTRGKGPEDFFVAPERCYIFVLGSSEPEVVAVLDTGEVRVDLKSRSIVEDWSEKYANHSQIWVAETR